MNFNYKEHNKCNGALVKLYCFSLLVFFASFLPMSSAVAADVCGIASVQASDTGPIRIRAQIPPGSGYTPGTPVGFGQNSGSTGTFTCSMPAGLGRVWFASGRLISAHPLIRRVAPGVYDYLSPDSERIYDNLRYVSGDATLSCLGKDGLRTAHFPSEAIAVSPSGDAVSVPCVNRPDGTVQITYTVSPMLYQVPANGIVKGTVTGSNLGGESYKAVRNAFLYNGAIGFEASDVNYPTLDLSRWSLLHTNLYNISTNVINSCQIQWDAGVTGNGLVDFGVVAAPSTPSVGAPLAAPRTLSLHAECNAPGIPSSMVAIGQIRGSADVSDGTHLASDDPSIGYEFKSEPGGVIIPVNTSSKTPTMTMNNGVARLEWTFSVAPVISRLPLLPGRTAAHAYIDLFLGM